MQTNDQTTQPPPSPGATCSPSFVPFDESWKKEVMKLPKSAIVDMYRKTCQQKLAADEALRNKEKAHEVTRRMLKRYSADLAQAKKTAVIMAMLASETPQFYNPLDVMEAKKLRALILAENVDVDATGPGTSLGTDADEAPRTCVD
jgi:hypothetical protein